MQISISSASSKLDLNKILAEFLEGQDAQLYQFFLGDREVKVSLQEALDR